VRDRGRRGRANLLALAVEARHNRLIRPESRPLRTPRFYLPPQLKHWHCAAAISRSTPTFPERTNSVVYRRDSGVSSAFFCGPAATLMRSFSTLTHRFSTPTGFLIWEVREL
jgi:hypothetical protein